MQTITLVLITGRLVKISKNYRTDFEKVSVHNKNMV